MAQPKQESTPKPASSEAGGDALGAQVDALLDEMDQAMQGLDRDSQEPEAAADTDGFEQSSFSDKPPPSTSRVANADSAPKEVAAAPASGGPPINQSQEELESAIDTALKAAPPAPAEDSAPIGHRQPATPEPDDEPLKAAPSGIQELDERLADTAGDQLDDDIDALLSSGTPPEAEAQAEAANPEPTAQAPSPKERDAAPLQEPDEAPAAQAPAQIADEPEVAASHAPEPAAQPKAPSSATPAPAAPSAPAPSAAAPAPTTQPSTPAPSSAPVEVVVGATEPEVERSPLLVRLCVGVLKVINAPLAITPPTVRDIVGYLALVTMFNAAGLWILLLLRH